MPGLPGPPGECIPTQCGDDSTTPDATSQHHVAFYATALDISQESEEWETVTMDTIQLNDGNGLNATTKQSVFTAPVAGVYSVMVTVVADGDGATPFVVFHNDQQILTTGRRNAESVGSYPLGHGQTVVRVARGDQIILKVKPKAGGFLQKVFNKFKDPSDVTFVGYLLYADVEDVQVFPPVPNQGNQGPIQGPDQYWGDY